MQFITFQDYKLWRDERLTGLIWKQMAVFAFTYLKLLKTYHRIARRIANFYLPYFYYFYLYFFTYTFIYNKRWILETILTTCRNALSYRNVLSAS